MKEEFVKKKIEAYTNANIANNKIISRAITFLEPLREYQSSEEDQKLIIQDIFLMLRTAMSNYKKLEPLLEGSAFKSTIELEFRSVLNNYRNVKDSINPELAIAVLKELAKFNDAVNKALEEILNYKDHKSEEEKTQLEDAIKRMAFEQGQLRKEYDTLESQKNRLNERLQERISFLGRTLTERDTALQELEKANKKGELSEEQTRKLYEEKEAIQRERDLFEGLKRQAVEEIQSSEKDKDLALGEIVKLQEQIKLLEEELRKERKIEKGSIDIDIKKLDKDLDIKELQILIEEFTTLSESINIFFNAEQKVDVTTKRVLRTNLSQQQKESVAKYSKKILRDIERIKRDSSIEATIINKEIIALKQLKERFEQSPKNSARSIHIILHQFRRKFTHLKSLTRDELHLILEIERILARVVKYSPKGSSKKEGIQFVKDRRGIPRPLNTDYQDKSTQLRKS